MQLNIIMNSFIAKAISQSVQGEFKFNDCYVRDIKDFENGIIAYVSQNNDTSAAIFDLKDLDLLKTIADFHIPITIRGYFEIIKINENSAMPAFRVQEFSDYDVGVIKERTNVKKELTLYEEIKQSTLQPIIKKVKTINPFRQKERICKARNHEWSQTEMNSINYCIQTKTPSHKKFSYLLQKLSKETSKDALRAKLRRMGYKVKNDVIIPKD